MVNWNINRLRGSVAYWILGLCNNFGYVVMLTAASDIIGHPHKERSNIRHCTYMSTGVILLADILPCLCSKFMAPFFPFFVHVRVIIVVTASVASYLLIAFSQNFSMTIMGVVVTSFGVGLGEATYLQYSSYFDKHAVSAWSAGTGAAGLIGSLSYVFLQILGLRNSMLVMLVVPSMMAVSFWLILPKAYNQEVQLQVNAEEIDDPIVALMKKIEQIPSLLKYIIPFTLVYFFEYFINQGMFELIIIPDGVIKPDNQYEWLQVCYQIGVFISRSSVGFIQIPYIGVLAFLQFVNVIFYTTEAIYLYVPAFPIMMVTTINEGILGGLAYVNTYYRISTEVPEEKKQFSMAFMGFGDGIGITLAGLAAISAHNTICDMPLSSSAIIDRMYYLSIANKN